MRTSSTTGLGTDSGNRRTSNGFGILWNGVVVCGVE
jgi:hypothetical protein